MASAQVMVLIVSVILVVITFAFFGYPIMMILHTSAEELNLKAFFNIQGAIIDANRHDIGISQSNFYLQRGYFIVIFQHTDILSNLTDRGGSSEVRHNYLNVGITNYAPSSIGHVNVRGMSGSDQLSLCNPGENCFCLINLNYKNQDKISTYKYNLLLFPNFVYGNPDETQDIRTTFFREERFIPLTTDISQQPPTDHPDVILRYSPGSTFSPDSPEYIETRIDYATFGFFNYFVKGVAEDLFTLRFISCKPLRELCSCSVCSFYKDKTSCEGWGFHEPPEGGTSIERGGAFGCVWDEKEVWVDPSNGEKTETFGVCYDGKGYRNATQDCHLWYTSPEKDKQYQLTSILELSSFEYIVFSKEGCALNMVDFLKKPIVINVLESYKYGDGSSTLFAQPLFRECDNDEESDDYKTYCDADNKDKVGACSFCIGSDCEEEENCPITVG